MQLNTLKRTHKNKKARQIGRAGQRGKTSGRGTKGQNARAGHKKRPEIRDFIKRIPKLRGRGKNLNTPIQNKYTVINLKNLVKFANGDVVSPATLMEKGIISKVEKNANVKILGVGTVTAKLTVTDCVLSAGARSAIEKAGGTIQ